MTFHTLVPPRCTTGMEYNFGVSIIRLRGIAGEPGFAVDTALARLNPRVAGPLPARSRAAAARHLRWRII